MVEPTWSNRELPVLQVIVDAMEEHPTSEATLQEITRRSGFSQEDVQKAMTRLSVAIPPFFEGVPLEELPYPISVTSVTERALRETEAWPNPESIVEALIGALTAEAEAEPDLEKRTRWRAAVDALSGFGREVAVGVVSAKLSGI